MFDCPHCGEPLEDDAEFCHHCGSDAETGWHPDTDYHAVELPEDELRDEEGPGKTIETQRGSPAGFALLIIALIALVGAGFVIRSPDVLLLLSLLIVCAVLFGWRARKAR